MFFYKFFGRENRASGMKTSGLAGDGEILIGAGRKRPSLVLTNLLGKGQGCVMVRLRDAVMAIALATGGVGCATFCDECDDFPSPGGPGGYSMMPGTYTGPPPTEMSSTTGGPAAMPADRTPSGPASTTPPVGEAAPTPPPAPSAAPAGRGGTTGRPTGPGGAASIMPPPGAGLVAFDPAQMTSPASATGTPAASASSPDPLPPLP